MANSGRFEFQRDKRGEEFVRQEILNPKAQFLRMLEVQHPPEVQKPLIPDYTRSLRQLFEGKEYTV